MKLSVDQARDVLRSLDPASSLAPADREAALRSVLETSDEVLVLGDYEPHGRRVFSVAAIAASVLLVVGVATWIETTQPARRNDVGMNRPPVVRTPSAIPSLPPGTALLPIPKDPNYRQALLAAQTASLRFVTLPGSRPMSTAPLADLNQAGFAPSSAGPNYVARAQSQYWTASGTPDQAVAYFESHQPEGAERFVSWGSAGSSNDVVGDCFDGPGAYVARCYFVQRYRGGVAVRAYAQVTWFRTKPAGMYVTDIESVDIAVGRSDPRMRGKTVPNVVRTLRGVDAMKLADVVNRATIGSPYAPPLGCPFSPSFSDRLEFHTTHGLFTVDDQLSGCYRQLHLTAPDVDQYLWDGDQLDKTLMALLGLPANYGYSK